MLIIFIRWQYYYLILFKNHDILVDGQLSTEIMHCE
jgi:hypothetical protein